MHFLYKLYVLCYLVCFVIARLVGKLFKLLYAMQTSECTIYQFIACKNCVLLICI